ncbi:FtsK/SpoIIIE domain-containing protein [Halobacillus karajensis]|uniref:FtsK/SpoIIIE domain-containing protein n=1 Tax=Halobacillus karajensis TaxID=195088 RepID=UPI00045C9F27|nr:FtsK/SpoIIIE domain-containing protein [Halobacillus karajensis]CDQ17927.1 DNA translocase FtsK [Halobacillus karajensis]
MIEYIPLTIALAAFIPKAQESDRKKLDTIFRNIGFGMKDQYPILINTDKQDHYTSYIYRKPLGLMNNEKLEHIIGHSLSKPVHVSGKRDMEVRVYHIGNMPRWDYEDIPEQDEGKWIVPIGKSLDGMEWHDFDKTPHMTIAGTTRFGKTVMLKNIMTYLIERNPDDVEFYILDFKGRLEFNPYRDLKQVRMIAGNADDAKVMLKMVWEEIQEQMSYFLENKLNNITKTPIRKRTFIITDEGGSLAPKKSHTDKQKKTFSYCTEMLEEICRVAGALGYRNIFATQYPTADSLPKHIKMNSDAKISFRLPTGYASEVAIDEYGAEELECPGRAIYKTHDRVTVQVPMLEDEDMEERLKGWELSVAEREEVSERRTNLDDLE